MLTTLRYEGPPKVLIFGNFVEFYCFLTKTIIINKGKIGLFMFFQKLLNVAVRGKSMFFVNFIFQKGVLRVIGVGNKTDFS